MTVTLPALAPRFGMRLPILSVDVATMADKGALVGLFDQYRQGAGQPSNIAAVDQYLTQRLTLGDSVSLLARVDNKPAGFIQLFKRYGAISMKPNWYIQDLFVKPGVRRLGVAKHLLKKAKALAVFDGSNRLDLKTKVDNYEALGLYTGQQFKQVEQSDQFVYYQWNNPQS